MNARVLRASMWIGVAISLLAAAAAAAVGDWSFAIGMTALAAFNYIFIRHALSKLPRDQ